MENALGKTELVALSFAAFTGAAFGFYAIWRLSKLVAPIIYETFWG